MKNLINKNSLEIENSIPNSVRLKEGIFFTKTNAIELLEKSLDFSNVKNVIDTGAGSCNFLQYFAEKYPNINFYGIEKNTVIYSKTKNILKKYNNIHYYNGDLFFDDFDIPKCDLYIGNPPWVSYIDLDSEYREKIKNIWTDIYDVKFSFKTLLGDSRGDLSQVFMSYSIDKYLNTNGNFAVVMPITSIRSRNNTSNDFRNFKIRNYEISISSIHEITEIKPFENTERTSCFLVGTKDNSTNYPIPYYIHFEDKIIQKELFNKENNLIFIDENQFNILGKSNYKARQGINTLGANDIFFFKTKPKFDSSIIKRLLKSSDIEKWSCTPSYWVLFPYQNKTIMTEKDLENFKEEHAYLTSNKSTLLKRKSKLAKIYYQLFGVGEYTFSEYKVVWKGLGAKKLEAAVIKEGILPNQSMHCYISTNSEMEANYICAILNSNFYEKSILQISESGAKSFGQPNIINSIKLPTYDSNNKIHKELANLSISFHKDKKLITLDNLEKLEMLAELVYS